MKCSFCIDGADVGDLGPLVKLCLVVLALGPLMYSPPVTVAANAQTETCWYCTCSGCQCSCASDIDFGADWCNAYGCRGCDTGGNCPGDQLAVLAVMADGSLKALEVFPAVGELSVKPEKRSLARQFLAEGWLVEKDCRGIVVNRYLSPGTRLRLAEQLRTIELR
ncbi:MAG: hypothetical protein KatS3mg081_0323 [Gemmatimonadales bacterium]|nr:MAG: hypothetical protein KatS3mg081_0323 [Gemmatimonadales bacterium]